MRTNDLLATVAVFALSLGACAADDEAEGDPSSDQEDGGFIKLFGGSWIAVEEPSLGDFKTIAIYKRGFFNHHLVYDVTQEIEIAGRFDDWGSLDFDEDELFFESVNGIIHLGVRFSMSGTDSERRLTLVYPAGTRATYRLNFVLQCEGSGDCPDDFGCKSGWCVPDRDF